MGIGLEERVRSAVAALLYATGESQSVLGAVLGVSQAQVSRRQRGTAGWTLADCEAVAAHYGIDVFDLLAGPTRAVEALSAARRRLGRRQVDALPPAAVEEGM
ncbi:helix-turn-helix domain-containing protein [Streptomyces sasae]|uniref:helix-turn-helix domain-containing protein n=1 Tax=Streptomyces sasae TaxID=1266772 RepID=UPI0029311F45|nr:helix-turn-helix domain-containing protein [Streptomyces sasae]